MKKVIAFLWAGVLALGLLTTGCAGEKEEKETKKDLRRGKDPEFYRLKAGGLCSS